MHFELMFPSKHLRCCDLMGREVVVKIAKVQVEELTMVGGKKQKKPCLYFEGKEKTLVLNKTNAKAIAEKHGKNTEEWVGKEITVYPTTTQFGRETVECIRIK